MLIFQKRLILANKIMKSFNLHNSGLHSVFFRVLTRKFSGSKISGWKRLTRSAAWSAVKKHWLSLRRKHFIKNVTKFISTFSPSGPAGHQNQTKNDGFIIKTFTEWPCGAKKIWKVWTWFSKTTSRYTPETILKTFSFTWCALWWMAISTNLKTKNSVKISPLKFGTTKSHEECLIP